MKRALLACGALLLSSPQELKASETEIEVHGYMSRGYMKSDKYNYLADNSKDSTTQWGEIGINFGYQAHERLRFGAQILARELGTAGEYNPELDWGFADYKLTDYASLKFGKFFAPWGLYNEGRDVDILRNSILPVQAIYNEDFRDISLMKGLELHGSFELNERNSIEYRLAKGNVDVKPSSTWHKDTLLRLSNAFVGPATGLDLNINGMTAYGLVWDTWIEGLRISHTSFEPDIDINYSYRANPAPLPSGPQYIFYDVSDWVTNSVEYTKDQWGYVFEHSDYSIDSVIGGVRAPLAKTQAYYHQLTYRLNDRYEFGVISSKYYGNTLLGKDAIDRHLDDLAFTVRVDMAEDWVLKLEYHDMSGIDGLRVPINAGLTAAANQGEDWDMIMAKVTYSF